MEPGLVRLRVAVPAGVRGGQQGAVGLAVVLLAVLAVGSLSIAWDYHKQLWLVLGLLAVQVAPQVALRVAAPAAGRMGGKPPEAGSRPLLTPVTSRL